MQMINTEKINNEVQNILIIVNKITIKTDEDLNKITETIRNVKTIGKMVKEQKERYTKPAQEIINNARKTFSHYEEQCEIAEKTLKNKASKYLEQKEKEAKEKEAKIVEKLEKGSIKEETAIKQMEAIKPTTKTIKTETGAKLTRRIIRKAYITDESLIPREYWIVDEARVKKAALAGAVIPGVKIKEESSISSF